MGGDGQEEMYWDRKTGTKQGETNGNKDMNKGTRIKGHEQGQSNTNRFSVTEIRGETVVR